MHWICDRLGTSTARDEPDMEQGEEVTVPPQSKTQALNKEIDGVIDEMTGNVKKMIKLGDDTGNLLKITMDLEREAQSLERTSQKVARTYWWKNVKLIVLIVVVVLIIVLIIILLAIGVIPVSAPLPPSVNPTTQP